MSATATSNVVEQLFQNIRQATEANIKMHQEAVRQWTSLWPVSMPQTAWTDALRDFQTKWSKGVSDLAKKHREVVDQQYQAAMDSLDAALHVSESTTPEEFRKRTEQLCRKMLDCMRDLTEAQIREFQDAVSKWTDVMTKTEK